MQVKLLKNWFDPGGSLRRKSDGAEGTYVPREYQNALPKSAVVLSGASSAKDEAKPDLNDPNLLANTAERAADRQEQARLQKLLDAGDATAAQKHKLKKLNEALAASDTAKEAE